MLHIALLAFLATSYGVPLPAQLAPGQLFYYPQPQYLKTGVHPFLQQYSAPPASKSIPSGHSQNDLIYYPSYPAPIPEQYHIRNQQPAEITPAATSRFTAPPEGLVNAIYTWFAENNVPLPDGPQRNEIITQSQTQEKIENPEKPSQAGEADVLAEAEKTPSQDLPKKPTNLKPGQRFYILNGQPQFVGLQTMYTQPLGPQQIVPQVVMRSALPEDQNLIFYQPQTELQQSNLKFRNSGIGVQNQEVYAPHNLVLLKNPQDQTQEEAQNVRPIRYHGLELNKKLVNQNFERPVVQNFGQPLFLERYLPQQLRQPQIYQTQYVPIGVVPPQENQLQQLPINSQYTLQNSIQNQLIPQDINNQQLSFIQIPVNKDVQIPQYIKRVVPITIDAKTKVSNEEIKTNPGVYYLSRPQEGKSDGEKDAPGVLYFSRAQDAKEPLQSRFATSEIQGQTDEDKNDPSAGLAALDFVRYIASRQNSDFADSVVIDAKTEEGNKEEDTESEDVVQSDDTLEPSVAQAQPAGIALAGPGGVAASAPRSTAYAGEKGLAVSSPRATAVAGPNTQQENKPSKTS